MPNISMGEQLLLPEGTKSHVPKKISISYGFWLKLLIIICILLFVPSEIHYREEFRVALPYYYYSISSVLMYYSRWEDAGGFEIPSLESHFIEPITLVSAIIILLPAIYLNRKLRERPADAPILRLGLTAIFATVLLTLWFFEGFPLFRFPWAIQSVPSGSLLNLGTMVIIILILLPLFAREAFLWGEERVPEAGNASRTRSSWLRKCALAGYAWGLMTFLIPFMVIIRLYDFDSFYFRYESPLYSFRLDGGDVSLPGNPNNWMIISLDVYQAFDFVSVLVVSALYIAFAFQVLRCLRGMTSWKRVIQLGILSILAPLMYQMVVAAIPVAGENYGYPIPIPIVLIIGIVAAVMIKPNGTRIGAEDSWENGASVQFPRFYYFKSKLRNFLRRRSKSAAA